MKQLFSMIFGLAACAGAVLFVARPVHVEAQLPSQIELACPQGSTPLPGGQVFNQITGKIRQWACVDTSGNVIHALAASSTVGGSAPATLPLNLSGGAGVV